MTATQDSNPGFTYEIPEVRPAFLRFRHYMLIFSFVLVVIVPVLLAGWLSWSFSGTLRQVTASVTVQEHSLGSFASPGSGISLQSAFKGGGSEETAIVRELVHSEDFYRTVAGQMDLSAIWPPDRPVPYWPPYYDPEGPAETGHSFWKNMVNVHIGSRDQIIRISVIAFDQDTAQRVLNAIRVEAERRLNTARAATLRIALEEAKQRVEELRVQYAEDSSKLLNFRVQNNTIDPEIMVSLNIAFSDFLRKMLADEEINIAATTASIAQGGELTRVSESRVAAISEYLSNIDTAPGQVITADEITALMAEYQPLLMDAEISHTSLRMAELSQMRFTQDLESNKVFLSSVTGGSMAAIEVFPQFLPTLLIVIAGSLVIWAILLIIVYAIRDRK